MKNWPKVCNIKTNFQRGINYAPLFFIGLIALIFVHSAQAETGWLREKIKERIIKRQAEKPAPSASNDTTSKILNAGDYTFSFLHGGIERYYKVHIPPQFIPQKAMPLLLSFHGGGGDMSIQATDEFYKLISKSDKEGFIIAFPNGYSAFKSGKLATWNAGNCCGAARDKNVDDVSFIKELIERLKKQLPINEKKIFASGMSNGGMMAYRLACELPNTFRAIAAVAGTDNTKSCTPTKAISILHIHAKDDDHVLFKGGAGKFAADASQITDFKSVPDTIAKWVKLNKCTLGPKKVLEKNQSYCELYTCPGNNEVQLCVTSSGGHSWPGGKKPRGESHSSTDLSATDVIWDFFKNK